MQIQRRPNADLYEVTFGGKDHSPIVFYTTKSIALPHGGRLLFDGFITKYKGKEAEFFGKFFKENGIHDLLEEALEWDGCWAIIYINQNGTVYCFTDPLGKKQLYYNKRGDICSQIKPLVSKEEEFELDYLYLGAIQKWGYNIDELTPFTSVKRVMPGKLYMFMGGTLQNATSECYFDWRWGASKLPPESLRTLVRNSVVEYTQAIPKSEKNIAVLLSGGIDSSVVACLAVGALGKENVKGLMMPSQFSSDSSVEDAKELADRLGIEYSVLPITAAYDAIMDTLKPVTGGTEFDSTEENIQSRIRTVLLMALQNKDGYILLNSSNKSENALGWCTLYGDTAGAFSPTGDLYKSEIYDLARYINVAFDNVIPEEILKKEPSSELRPNHKDSDILPPYEVVDAILYRMIEKGEHREEIINAGFDQEVVELIHTMVMRNVKKRYQYPPVLRLSTCSFRHECLFPLVNKYGY